MKNTNLAQKIFITVLSFLLFTFSPVSANTLSGDTRLACEAILCLSSPINPSECTPALARYFGISFKRFSKTLSARRDFLNLCPTSSANEVMQTLTSAIAYGAGRCDATELNKKGKWITKTKRLSLSECSGKNNISEPRMRETWKIVYSDDENPRPEYCKNTLIYWKVEETPPTYCVELWEHQNTDFEKRPSLKISNKPGDTYWVDQN